MQNLQKNRKTMDGGYRFDDKLLSNAVLHTRLGYMAIKVHSGLKSL